jgi:hypothetical protein
MPRPGRGPPPGTRPSSEARPGRSAATSLKTTTGATLQRAGDRHPWTALACRAPRWGGVVRAARMGGYRPFLPPERSRWWSAARSGRAARMGEGPRRGAGWTGSTSTASGTGGDHDGGHRRRRDGIQVPHRPLVTQAALRYQHASARRDLAITTPRKARKSQPGRRPSVPDQPLHYRAGDENRLAFSAWEGAKLPLTCRFACIRRSDRISR